MTFKVVVRFFTTLREITGKKEEQIEFSQSANVNAVLRNLSENYGAGFNDYVFDELGDVRSHLEILVNGRSISTLSGLRTQLKDGDQVAILPPVGGG